MGLLYPVLRVWSYQFSANQPVRRRAGIGWTEMKQAYEAHESAYRRMRQEGILSWDDMVAKRKRTGEILKETQKQLWDVLSQPWMPRVHTAIELGCGIGPIARWLCRKMDTKVLGIDISKTAVAMARQQSRMPDVQFKHADVCTFAKCTKTKFDLAVDGRCLHCITEPRDRKAFFKSAKTILRKGGVLIIMTMCRPMDMSQFYRQCRGQKFVKNVIYLPWSGDRKYRGTRSIRGKVYLPTRYVGHWQSILREITGAGFELKYVKYLCPVPEGLCGDLIVGAMA
jgi:cyclopropane fatty-acyl-phospholipid synthase-like methyltransferase